MTMEIGVDSTRFSGPRSSRAGGVKSAPAARQHALHTALSLLNRERLDPAMPTDDFVDRLQATTELMRVEHRFLEGERRKVAARARTVPRDPKGFAEWFEELRNSGPGQYDSGMGGSGSGMPLFEFLANRATLEELKWFMLQEVAGEAGFDDLVALTQLKAPEQAKLELARNFWDEMGRGKSKGMHGPMLTRLAHALGITSTPLELITWESLALGNLLTGLAYNRRYAYHSIGALGAIELTSTTRAPRVVEALDRLGIPKEASHYFRLHATVDIGHWRGWCDNVAVPIVAARPEAAVCIAEGALMRLTAGERTFARYRAHFAGRFGS